MRALPASGLALGLAGAVLIVAVGPAQAYYDDHHDHHDHHDHYDHRRGPPPPPHYGPGYYAPPPVYYAPPQAYYAPPPVYYGGPGASVTFSIP